MNCKSILFIAAIGPLAEVVGAQTGAPATLQNLRVPVEQRIAGGVIRGYVKSSLRMFKGVPYAVPPVGPLRWRPPEPVAPWSGVLDAGPTAMRHNDGSNEDCLYLNVWMPNGLPRRDLPVMVWLGDEDGGPICSQGVLFVGFDYRRGVFGFLPLPGLTAESGRGTSGNYGFMDMIAVLRWVRDNAAFLGGDPNNVTLVGTGDAADAVSAAMIAPEARGLFCRAIAGSGGLVSSPGHPIPKLAWIPMEGKPLTGAIGRRVCRSDIS